MNRLLQRQLGKYIKNTNEIPEDVQALLNVISESYDHYEKDRKMLERSIELTSMEMIALHDKLRKETEEENKAVYNSLSESLSIINDTQGADNILESDFRKLSQIANVLKDETRKRRIAEKEKIQHASHLEASQKIAHIGSWELEIKDISNLSKSALYWSDETYRIFGFEPGAVKASYELFIDNVHPDDVGMVQTAVAKSLQTGEAYDIEHRIVLANGVERTVHGRSDVVIEPTSGKAIKMIGTLQDITERKKIAQRLIKANDELRLLFESMQESFFSVDMKNYKLTQISQSCKDIYGYTPEEFLQNSNLWLDVILEDDKQEVWANDSKMRMGESIINTYRIHHKEGGIRWLETKIKPTLNESKELLRIDGVTADITKKIEAEQALKNSEYRFRTFIENSSDATVVIDENFNIIFASDSLFRVTGFKAEDVIGESNFDSIYFQDRIDSEIFFKSLLGNSREPKTIIYRIHKKDGTVIWTERVVINLLDDPVIKGIVINFRDITQRKEYEDALKRSNDELKKSNSELDRFVYSVSHDLRAPLSSILGIIGLVEAETTDKEIIGDIQLIKNNVKRLDGFICDILDYSRNARLELKKDKIDFVNLLEYIKSNLKYMASSARDVSIKINVNEHAIFYSDVSRISVILNNLISNSIRYSNPGIANPFVEINIDSRADKTTIIIKDNGIGIDENNQAKVFDMFYRVSKKSVGSGLGLYIVKETVEKLHGTIRMESIFGEGTTFIIVIPNQEKN